MTKSTLLSKSVILFAVLTLLFSPNVLMAQDEDPCDLEALSAEISEIEAQIESAEQEQQLILDELESLDALYQELTDKLASLNEQASTNSAEGSRIRARLKKLEATLHHLISKSNYYGCPASEHPVCEEIASQIEELTPLLEEAQLDRDANEAEATQIQEEIDETESLLTLNYQQRQLLKAQYNARNAKLKALTRKMKVLSANLSKCCKLNRDVDGDGHISVYCGGDDCDDKDDSVYPGAPEICNDGKDNDCDGLVDESDMSVDAGTCVSAYFGYAPMDGATLNASVSGGSGTYSYAWSNGGNTSSITVTPSETTEYSVTVTDSYGCTAVASVTVQVIDVRCGNNGDKVMVCHSSGKSGKTEQLCIASSAVKAHLKHGDQLGACDQDDPCGNSAAMSLDPDLAEMVSELEESFHIYPNPAQTEIAVIGHSASPYSVEVLNTQGNSIMNFKHQTEDQKVDVSGLPNGIYFFRIQSGNYQQIERVVIMH